MSEPAKSKGSGCGGCLSAIVVIGVIALVIAALAGGSSSSTPTTPEPPPAPATTETETQPAPAAPESDEEDEGTGSSGDDEVGSSSHAGDTKFCEEHTCEGNFTGEEGTVAECSDGTYSHAGGISGACSDHGGEASKE
jgi:hypothetical protein